jgi:hypothetical protein
MIFVKLSLGMFFLRIIIQKHLRQAVYVIMVVSTLYNLFTAFWDIGLCGNPTNYVSNLMTGKCVPTEAQMALTYVHGAVNTLTDIAFACLPFILLRHSSLPQKIKVYIYFILGLSTMQVPARMVLRNPSNMANHIQLQRLRQHHRSILLH